MMSLTMAPNSSGNPYFRASCLQDAGDSPPVAIGTAGDQGNRRCKIHKIMLLFQVKFKRRGTRQ